MIFAFGIALSFIARSSCQPMYQEGCNLICNEKGRERGVMISNWTCVCDGYKRTKDKRIKLP